MEERVKLTETQIRQSIVEGGALKEVNKWGKDRLRAEYLDSLVAYSLIRQELDAALEQIERKPEIILP